MRVLAFDIETADADQMHSYGPGFVRLCGWQWLDAAGDPQSGVQISHVADDLVAAIELADAITAHNGGAFDAMALAKYEGLDYEAAVLKLFDTLLAERHLNPVAARGAQPNDYYRLGDTAERYGLDGKDLLDFPAKVAVLRRIKGDAYADRMLKNEAAKVRKCERVGIEYTPPRPASCLKVLADAFGGYDQIPTDDPDYRRYLVKDVLAQAGVYRVQRALVSQLPRTGDGSQAYLRREHYVAAATGRITLNGMRVDVDLTMRRWSEGQARLEASTRMLHEKYDMPLEGKKPHTTNQGKAALRRALLGTGLSEQWLARNWPLNKDGSLSTSKDVLTAKVEFFEGIDRPQAAAAAELCSTILAMNGERTVYGTFLNHLVDGRVHPTITPDQASGRWGMRDPGATVLGKRGGKARERAMVRADDGMVLVAIDADQIDARMVAALSQDPEYLKLFGPGVDLHSEVAFRVWPDPSQHGPDCHRLDEFHDHSCGVKNKCHCEKRDRAKVFGHGWNYGMQWKTMAANHGVDPAVTQAFCTGMSEAFPVLAGWQSEMRAAAGALPWGEEAPTDDSYRILYTAFGRPVRVERNRAFTQATALIGQGSTRDGMAQAILNLPPEHRRNIIAIVHDEIVVQIPDGPDAQDRAQSLADSMAFELRGVTLSFGCSRVARCWAGCYQTKPDQYCQCCKD